MSLRRSKRHDQDAQRFQLRQDLISIGDDYWVEDEARREGVQGRRQGRAVP